MRLLKTTIGGEGMADAERAEVIREIKAARVRLSREEDERLKLDLLNFIHSVSCGEFSDPEQVRTLIPAVETVARFF